MLRAALVIAVSVLTSQGCVTDLTSGGSNVRELTVAQTEGCEYLGVVTASHGTAWTSAGDNVSVVNELHNAAYEKGGDSFVVIRSRSNELVTTARAQVFKCGSSQVSPSDIAQDVSAGTCFYVSRDGLAVTNSHVIQGAHVVTIEAADGVERAAGIVANDAANDLAVLKTTGSSFAYISLASQTATVGQEVFTMGFPVTSLLGEEPKYTDGSISALSGIDGAPNLMQITVPVQPGNSGGPLVDSTGQVVGVVTSTAAVGRFVEMSGTLPQNVNWAVKSGYLKLLVDGLSSDTEEPERTEDPIESTRMALCRVYAER